MTWIKVAMDLLETKQAIRKLSEIFKVLKN